MFIIVTVTSFMGSLFTVGMRLSGRGGIGLGRTAWCIPFSGFVLNWFSQLHFSSVSPILHLVVLADPARIDEEFRKASLPCFCRSGQRDTSLEEFNNECDGWLPLLPEVPLPWLLVRCLMLSVARVLRLVVLKVGVGGS